MDDVAATLDAVAAAVQSLGLEYGGVPIPVFKRKKAMHREKTEPQVTLSVYPSVRAHESVRFDSESDRHTYNLNVALIAPGDRDNLTGLLDAAAVEAATRDALNATPSVLSGVEGLLDVRAERGRFLDRAALKADWDVVQVDVTVEAVRARAR